MKLTSIAVAFATAGLAAAQHGHGHHHKHKRTVTTVTVEGPTIVTFQLDGKDISAEEACSGIRNGSLLWAHGIAPPGACAPSTTSTVTPAEFFATSSTISVASTTSTSSTTSSTSSTSTSSSTTTTSTTSVPPPPPPPPPASSTTSTAAPPAVPSTQIDVFGSGGGVNIVNGMSQVLYLWSVSNVPAPMQTVSPGNTYSEPWGINPDGGGFSVKVSTVPDLTSVVQFEYTLTGAQVFWDVSLINLADSTYPLTTAGFTVTTNSPNCAGISCPVGNTKCSAAYLIPDDNQATHGCAANTVLTLTLGA